MSRAEELSKNRYPTLAEKYAFIDGYVQAEKDLELTWEDIEAIDQLLWDLCGEYSGKKDNEGYYQEVLKRFNKERKNKLNNMIC